MDQNILIQKGLVAKEVGRNFIRLKDVPSTNEYIAENAATLENGTVVAADFQSKGRGRLDHKWVGEKGKALMFSILLKTSLPQSLKVKTVFVCALAIKLAIKKLYGITSYIKWPNDIYIENKKVAGILCQMQENSVICGMGINVNQEEFKGEIKEKASSLYLITGIKKELFEVLACILNFFEDAFSTLEEEGFYPIREEVLRHFYLKDKEVGVVSGKKTYNGRVLGMDDEGNLLLSEKGKTIKVSSGDVHICF